MRHGSLFSGIGGFDLAAEWMGWENIFHCEWNKFGQQVLKYYWPNAISYENICTTDFTIHRGQIDIITGGFPCQPYSMAGKRLGKEDERHLWPETLRTIREIQPRWVVGENVLGLVNWSDGLVFHEVQTDLENEGYEVQPYVLPAASVNAPHRRDRVWFVAHSKGSRSPISKLGESQPKQQLQTRSDINRYDDLENASNPNSNGLNERNGNNEVNTSKGRINAFGDINESNGDGDVADSNGTNNQTRSFGKILGQPNWEKANGYCNVECSNKWQNFPTVSPICIGDDGLSDRLDSITFPKWRNESIKAGGNAIVPQVVYQIFKTISEYERTKNTNED